MHIIYADSIGQIAIEINGSGIDFCGEFAYFTDTNGKDYKIQITSIRAIKSKEV